MRRVLGLIPARGGSKGVPRKNIRSLGGIPLIAHTIRAVDAAGCVDRLCVSTDDPEIQNVCRGLGVEVPWLRPQELATDDAAVIDVAHDAVQRLATVGYHPDGVLLLQPTSPFRSPASIRMAVEMFNSASRDSVVAVTPVRDHPYWCKLITAEGLLEDPWGGQPVAGQRQGLPPFYRIAGSIYLAPTSSVTGDLSFYAARTHALVVSQEEAQDIDTEFDWHTAESYWSRYAGPQAGAMK